MIKLPFGKKTNVSEPQRGRFIVIDGSDGTGKSTQTKLLLETLRMEGFKAEEIEFPQYQHKSAGPVEEYLSGKYGNLNPYATSVFYAIDRFDASFKIKEWLKAGKVVISNRYVTANAGHQGGKIVDENERVKYFRWLHKLEYEVFTIPKPDLNIILHMPVEFSLKLLEGRRVAESNRTLDMHEADTEHLKNSIESYLQIAKLFPNTKLLECVEAGQIQSPQRIRNLIWQLVRRIALKDFVQKK
jgi:dTMP kinase